jgi:glucan phosphoethanolaminetransferase (alkaline phosphatase superfamily)
MPVLYVLFPGSVLAEPPMPFNILIFLALWACCALAQVYRYRRVSGPVGRQQTKWVVFGVTACVALLVGFLLPFVFFPALGRPGAASLVSNLAGLTVAGSFGFLLIPVSIGAAILRYRLYDIDVIINRALVYSSLTAVLILVYLAAVVSSQYVVRTLSGQESQLAVVASTLAVAALFGPMRRRLQNVIDRRFYRRKYDASRILATYGAQLREDVDLKTLSDDLLGVVGETVQPVHASLWLRPPDGTPPAKGRKA